MSEPTPPPSLARFEQHVSGHRYPEAWDELLRILDLFNQTSGGLSGFDLGIPVPAADEAELCRHMATRIIAAYGQLLNADPQIAPHVVEALLLHHRWIDAMAAVSGFGSLNHLILGLPRAENGQLILDSTTLQRFLLLFSPSSGVSMDFDECAQVNGLATLVALLGYLGSRTFAAPSATAFREQALDWLPGKLGGLSLGAMLLGFMPNEYMHCSYALHRGKHRVKADLIAQMRQAMLRVGAPELTGTPPARERPKIVVVCEHFHSQHSVYRTHSRAVRALQDGFEVIGLVYADRTDDLARDCFHRVISYPEGEIIEAARQCAELVAAEQPDIVFHLGVGMSNHSIALASLRLAPVQCVSYGHTATTMSPVIDYMILPDDFIGATDLYSETLLRFPPESIPYAPPEATEAPVPPRAKRKDDGTVRIAVPASIMKINATFLQALAAAAQQAKHPVEFQFFPLGAVGLGFYQLERDVKRLLPGAVVYPQSDRTTYLQRLGACDLFVSPFPYGNMNSIIDAIIMAVPGVCLDGEEAHAHADVAIFRRLGLPDELSASDIPGYVAAIVKLVDDPRWRQSCQKIAAGVDLEATTYAGDESLFCAEMLKLLPVTVVG